MTHQPKLPQLHFCLKKDVSGNIGIGKKYHGVPKLVKLRYEGTKPFHLVGTIPESFKKVARGSNMYRTVIKERQQKKT